ncbi:L,D-transpeptidase [bacterium]|nr:L,D-transpeptidase [bacterium]
MISKSAQSLVVYDGDREVLRAAVVLGKNPVDKQHEGDLATPEGEFYICYRNPESRYHRFLGISYPNSEDAERGLRAAAISRAEHDAICTAIARRECPPWNTALGGEIGLHGPCPNRTWTHGCVAMSVSEIEELDRRLKLGDPVTIVP